MKKLRITDEDTVTEVTALKALPIDRLVHVLEDPKCSHELRQRLRRPDSDAFIAYFLTLPDDEWEAVLESHELFEEAYHPGIKAEDAFGQFVARAALELDGSELRRLLHEANFGHAVLVPARRGGSSGREFSVVAIANKSFVFLKRRREN